MQVKFKKYPRETFIARAELIVKAYDDLSQIYEIITDVAREMNGKVYNKRFKDAVNERIAGLGRMFVGDKDAYFGWRKVTILIDRRWSQETGYIDDDVHYDSINDIARWLVNNRIDANATANEIARTLQHIHAAAQNWRDAADNYDMYAEQLNNAIAGLRQALNGINPLFKPTEIIDFDWE